MSWFKKKEENELLPNLPESAVELPALPEAGNLNIQMKSDTLPTLPNSNPNNSLATPGTNNQMQKSSFEPLPTSNEVMIPKTMIAELPNIAEVPIPTGIPEINKPSRTKKNEPVYIRLDKFKAGLESFEEIKNKIRDIEELLLNIRAKKEEEERELEEWEREIQIIKSRIESIDSNVFNRLD